MWEYIKQLEYPVPNLRPNAAAAKVILSQYGGPNGEIGASLRYLSQRYAMPDKRVAGLLTDIGTEELAHMEMVGELVKQLSSGLSTQEIIDAGLDAYFVDHTIGIYPAAANGMPFTAATIQSVGDPIADLSEDMAADAAIIKEQPLREKSRKPLKYKDFSHLGKTPGNRIRKKSSKFASKTVSDFCPFLSKIFSICSIH